ncbi:MULTISPECIES: SDR family NAD(P)-dependent oxidoreductase [Streptomyces]|jgi:NAD(P)-dependent dehydrogenase (short-subunit alcohol dehydrogenase family)|uniref:SDR family NAD(P)-dependent oxidoreductase n=1 Tax=Streptomyces TaxID=1883 RepID=UPI000BB1194B|nr:MULTISPECIES: glucose 1-dehydrogenase [Streptomyces]MCX4430847.1 SDR family oxidoreductase [Streptomyces mirabilis]PBD01856.1 NAD(P)-dependent dehydrogenase (short-subunit alcohol dehydrogenase family) [Streptomyces sp. Ag82_O1-15]SOE79374.1 NAD(P)-dependent dehydrogenase, short-chain alcohol dehydrogenase family [Streptomyces sp. OV198]
MNRLDGKVAVVTGGSSGIGFATAQRFVEEGAFVFITGRRRPELDKAKDEIGRNVATVQGDVSVSADLDRLFRTVAEDKGKIDVVVANSGLVDPQMFGRITEASFDRTFNVNARGALFTAQKALPLMNDGGSVILVGSIAGHIGVEGYTTYSATKAALRSYARTWTKELKGRGIRVNVLSPGPIDTPIMDSQADSEEGVDAIKAAFASVIPLGRMGRPEEVAAAAVFLASDESSFCAGMELSVDGGMAQV